MLPYELVNRNFFLSNGRLFRQFSKSTKQVVTRNNGHLITTLANVRYQAIDIAWTLLYGNWPLTNILLVGDGFSKETMLPIEKASIYCSKQVKGGFSHNLSSTVYLTRFECDQSFARNALRVYATRLKEIQAIEAERLALRLRSERQAVETCAIFAKHGAGANSRERPKRPKQPKEKPVGVWYRLGQDWHDVPFALRVDDDIKNRCIAMLQGLKACVVDDVLVYV